MLIRTFLTCCFLLILYLAFSNSCSPPSSPLKSPATDVQNQYDCKNGRFEKDIFSQLVEHKNILYGSNVTMQKQKIKLTMNIFEPEEDPNALRPLVIWAHGGYFVYGDKSEFNDLCKFLSHKGWVTATMDYRKWRKKSLPDSLEYMETAIRATHDMHACIRFFKKDAANENKYKIDTNKIFVGGYSAGAIMAAQVAYLNSMDEVPSHLQEILKRNGGIPGNSGNPGYSSAIAGSIVIAGAVYNKNIIEKGAHPPFLGIQGSKDGIVPFNRGWARSPMDTKVIELDGTSIINKTNKKLGYPSTLLTLPRGDHMAAWDEMWYERTVSYIHQFLLENTCEKSE